MNSVSKLWSSLWIKQIIISGIYQFHACWKFDLVVCYINYTFSCAFCIMTLSRLLTAYVQKERTTFICKGWRVRFLFFFGTSVNNNPLTQLIKSDDLSQHQRYGNLSSYIFIVPITFNYKFINLKLQHSSRKGDTTPKYNTQLWRLRHSQRSRGNLLFNEIKSIPLFMSRSTRGVSVQDLIKNLYFSYPRPLLAYLSNHLLFEHPNGKILMAVIHVEEVNCYI
jgi:hypothetical protein